MRKLLIWAFIVTILCVSAYLTELRCGLAPQYICLVITIPALVAFAVIIACTSFKDFAISAFVAAIGSFSAYASFNDFSTRDVTAVAFIVVALVAKVTVHELKLKYYWTFLAGLSLILEATVIFMVLRYGHLILSK